MRVATASTALHLPRLNNGIPNNVLGVIWGPMGLCSIFLGTSFGYVWALPFIVLGVLFHAVMRWLFKKDYKILEIYINYAALETEYHPHVRDKVKVGKNRPKGFGRGLRI